MTRAECRTAIRAATDQDASDENNAQVTRAQLDTWIDIEHKLLRRELGQIAPTLYSAATGDLTADATTGALTMPADYERMIRVERKVGTSWHPVAVSDGLSPHIGDLQVREEGGALFVSPVSSTSGITFRIVYVQKPNTLAAESGTNGVLLVPDGCEEVIVQRVAARVRERFRQESQPHAVKASQIWKEQRTYLRRRYGASPVPGLKLVRRW